MKKEDSTLPTISSSKQERGVDHLGYSTNYKGAGTSFMGNVFINRGNIQNKSQLSIQYSDQALRDLILEKKKL